MSRDKHEAKTTDMVFNLCIPAYSLGGDKQHFPRPGRKAPKSCVRKRKEIDNLYFTISGRKKEKN